MRLHGSVLGMTSLPALPSLSSVPAWSRRTWALLMTLCLVLFLAGLDVSMIGVALPSIGTELDLSTSSLQWLVSGYVLGYGGGVPPRGPPPRPPPRPPRVSPRA